ncbi:MAG: MMPL family transporter [Micromonosporaceae bacterium]
MFAWWGKTVHRLRWTVLMGAVAFVAFAAVWGTGVFDELTGGGFEQPGSESVRATERIADEIGDQQVDLIALYSSDRLTVTDTEFRDAVTAAADRALDRPGVSKVSGYYDTGNPALVSNDQHATYLAVQLDKDLDPDTIRDVRDALAADGLTTDVGGPQAIFLDVNSRVSDDIARAEMISMPILLILLLLVFGSLVAASTPLLVGTIAVLGGFTVVRMLTTVTDVSVFSINIITILGLGLAIDYALFVVSRFREELDAGREVPEAIARTMATAGRTVAVSGVTVALALAGLLIFPQVFLRSMGLGGVAAVAVAMLASLTVLPALLAVLGHRIDAVRLPWARRSARRTVPTVTSAVAAAAESGGWARFARAVMRRPVGVALGTVAVLAFLTVPFLGVKFGGVDERVLPEGTQSRVVSERLKADFPNGQADPIVVLVSGGDAAGFTEKIKDIPGVRDAVPTANRGESTVITVSYRGAATSTQARDVVADIRALDRPAGADVLVGGQTAQLVDLLAGLGERLPWMALIVAGVTFLLLFAAFGSILLPLKAILMNLLSIGASFGAVVWIFQEGNLADLLAFTPTGFLEATQPILMLAILFGLSMDYEVFLLSRVREQWDLLGDNIAAVASGVQRTGRIITAAALLLIVVVGAFATSGITFIKMIGLGMAVAILVDATLVRMLLVPATMRLLGRYNWWLPRFLRPVYARYAIRESDTPDPASDSRPRELTPVG